MDEATWSKLSEAREGDERYLTGVLDDLLDCEENLRAMTRNHGYTYTRMPPAGDITPGSIPNARLQRSYINQLAHYFGREVFRDGMTVISHSETGKDAQLRTDYITGLSYVRKPEVTHMTALPNPMIISDIINSIIEYSEVENNHEVCYTVPPTMRIKGESTCTRTSNCQFSQRVRCIVHTHPNESSTCPSMADYTIALANPHKHFTIVNR